MVTADATHSKPYLPTTSPNNFMSQHYRGLSFGPQDQKSGLMAMPLCTEREAGPKLARQKLVAEFPYEDKSSRVCFH